MKHIMKKFIATMGIFTLISTNSFSAAAQDYDILAATSADIASLAASHVNVTSILNSYYSYNGTDAYRLIKSNALKRFLNQWTAASIVNPVWNYNSFTKYEGQNLYYCTFTADNGRNYYMVLRYDASDGGGLGKVRYGETSYNYDLRANIDVISAKLSETQLDLSSTVAYRAQLKGAEVIIFKDNSGKKYAFYFDTSKIVRI
ncbi:hypothetical protein ACOAOT_13765 [Lacrimispora sp. AGF001]|uniref:hypothetical protein n=1 Tax=Lacrimispora sp. AGF001 TaxID=3401631 RepID=UPI003B42C5D1